MKRKLYRLVIKTLSHLRKRFPKLERKFTGKSLLTRAGWLDDEH